MSSVPANSVERNDTVEDAEARQAARDAVMEIPLFPDLIVRLRDALGYGPHCEMLQHYCYWMNPEKRKMRNRWSIWKTFDEWYEECGLTDRQVKKGRKKLRELGIMSHKRGQYSRVYYQVDWVALADALDLSYVVDEDDIWFEDDEHEFIPDGNSVPNGNENGRSFRTATASDFIPDGNSVQFIPDGYGVRLNTKEYAGDYLSGESSLQEAPEPAFAEPGAMNGNGKKEEKDSPPPVEDKRHSQDSDTPSTEQALRDEVEEVVAPPKPDDDTLLAEMKDVLDPSGDRWWAASVFPNMDTLASSVVVGFIRKNPEEIESPETLLSATDEELTQAVTYVMWAERED